jgi:hypothetical protein
MIIKKNNQDTTHQGQNWNKEDQWWKDDGKGYGFLNQERTIYIDQNGQKIIGAISDDMKKILEDINLRLTPINTKKQ